MPLITLAPFFSCRSFALMFHISNGNRIQSDHSIQKQLTAVLKLGHSKLEWSEHIDKTFVGNLAKGSFNKTSEQHCSFQINRWVSQHLPNIKLKKTVFLFFMLFQISVYP